MYTASEKRYDTLPCNRLGNSGLKLPAVSLGLWHNFDRIPKEGLGVHRDELKRIEQICLT